jgi:hypothetical protein
MKKLVIKKISALIITAFLFITLVQTVQAATTAKQNFSVGLTNTAANMGYSTRDDSITEKIGLYLKIFLSFLGVIFLGLTLYAGYLWMTAAGEKEKVAEAQKTLKAAIIGLIIVVTAYTLTSFISYELDAGVSGGNQEVLN